MANYMKKTFVVISLILFLILGSLDAVSGTEQLIIRNYTFPPRIFLGEDLRQLVERSRNSLPPKAVKIFRKRLLLVDNVKKDIEKIFYGMNKERQNIFRKMFNATIKDIKKVREFTEFDIIYLTVHEGNDVFATVIIGYNQLIEWSKGMLNWGVIYSGNALWPKRFLLLDRGLLMGDPFLYFN